MSYAGYKLAIRNVLQRLLGIAGLSDRVEQLDIETTIAARFAKAAVTSSLRRVAREQPLSWEFSGFSQHGEDGIIEYLISEMTGSRRFFIEIGAADGLENCTAWLALAHGFRGIMIEGNADLARRCAEVYKQRNWNVHVLAQYATPESLGLLIGSLPFMDPDVLSVDVDGIDYYLVKQAMQSGLRPKILVLEYNSTFGPNATTTVEYDPLFNRWSKHSSGVYYGASVSAYEWLLSPLGYKLVTVDSTGTNVLFIHAASFRIDFVSQLNGDRFRVNLADRNPTNFHNGSLGHAGRILEPDWQESATQLVDMPLIDVREL